jgi:hypothetical protein
MDPDSDAAVTVQPTVLYRWSARRMQPIVLLSVAVVFLVMMAVSYFVVHSMSAVKALATAAVAAIVSLVPTVLMRIEYRLTDRGIERRSQHKAKPKPFESLFRLDELDHVVPIGHGFKYVKVIDESRPFQRFWKRHLSDEFSGEIQVETADRKQVLAILAEKGVRVGSANSN